MEKTGFRTRKLLPVLLAVIIAIILIATSCSKKPVTTTTTTATAPTTAVTTTTTTPITITSATTPVTTTTTTTTLQTVTIALIAENLAFNTSTITVTRGASVTINFTNRDGLPHNFAVYTNSGAGTVIFRGDVINNGSIVYTFTAPPTAETYFFRCDVHFSSMTGRFIVQ